MKERMKMLLQGRIERYLKQSGAKATRFGRDVAGDPRLVFDMRRGRHLGARLSARVDAYLTAVGQ
jgi:hypothetical protein